MSVALMISNPINEEEDKFYVPIATEKVFEDFWMPIVEELDLKMVRYFQSGIEIEKAESEYILSEITRIREWVTNNMNNDRGSLMLERLENLKVGLNYIFSNQRDDIKAYIG